MKHSVFIHISDGGIVNKPPVKALFASLPNGKYLVEVSSAKKRSNQQNRYYHGLVVPMVRQGLKGIGNDVTLEETHEFLKAEFNYSEIVNTSTGEIKNIPLSTTRLTTIGFMEFIEKVQRWAAEWLGINIPSPNEQLSIDYEIALAKYDQDLNTKIIQ